MSKSFFDLYFSYVGETECPRIFHRWTAISCVAALLGRSVNIPFGHSNIYPNLYVMLMGQPGTRKSTAIKIGQKLISQIGYGHFSADRTSKEALWLDMTTEQERNIGTDDLDLEELRPYTPTELFIVADEFNDFMGIRNEEFQTALTKMWDCPAEYTTRAKASSNTSIYKPTINILGGNTPSGLSKGFGPEAINGGFFSRIVFVHSEPTDTRIPFPAGPALTTKIKIEDSIRGIRDAVTGTVTIIPKARACLASMYTGFPGLNDSRFQYYTTRRHTNLLKLSMILAAMEHRMEITEEDCITANTILHTTELMMPQAFGEFGLGKHADVSNTVMEIIKKGVKSGVPVPTQVIWKAVHRDLNDPKDLNTILHGLIEADKISVVTVRQAKGFLPVIVHENQWANGLIDYSLLTTEERIGDK